MCSERGGSVSDQSNGLCNQRDCELRKKGGVWICCVCDFGFRGTDRNRYGHCVGCDHAVCEDCKKWTRETAAELHVDEEKDTCAEERESSADDDTGSEQAVELEDKDDEAYGQRNDASASGSVYSPSDKSDDGDDD